MLKYERAKSNKEIRRQKGRNSYKEHDAHKNVKKFGFALFLEQCFSTIFLKLLIHFFQLWSVFSAHYKISWIKIMFWCCFIVVLKRKILDVNIFFEVDSLHFILLLMVTKKVLQYVNEIRHSTKT